MKDYPKRRDVRFDPTIGERGAFVMACPRCRDVHGMAKFWEITTQHWSPKLGLQFCRACHHEIDRARRRAANWGSPEAVRATQRAYYHRPGVHERRLAWKRAYYAANRERLRIQANAYAAARRNRQDGLTVTEVAGG